MSSFENRSGADLMAVITGSAEDAHSQPGLSQSSPGQKKTPTPGALERGFLCAFVTLVDSKAFTRSGQQGGNPSRTVPSN